MKENPTTTYPSRSLPCGSEVHTQVPKTRTRSYLYSSILIPNNPNNDKTNKIKNKKQCEPRYKTPNHFPWCNSLNSSRKICFSR